MKLKSIVVASVVALTALSSQAATTDWGMHDATETSNFVFPASGLFLDKYTFSLTSAASVLNTLNTQNISDGTYGIYAPNNTAVALWSFVSGLQTHTVSLAAGSYVYKVFGDASASAAYTLNSIATVTPVPEPETYAMLLAGLGVIGFVAKRRNKLV